MLPSDIRMASSNGNARRRRRAGHVRQVAQRTQFGRTGQRVLHRGLVVDVGDHGQGRQPRHRWSPRCPARRRRSCPRLPPTDPTRPRAGRSIVRCRWRRRSPRSTSPRVKPKSTIPTSLVRSRCSPQSDRVAAVDVELLAADESGPRAGQEAHRLGDVGRRTEPAQRDVRPGDRAALARPVRRRRSTRSAMPSVSMPGPTQFTRIPYRPSSAASARATASTAPLVPADSPSRTGKRAVAAVVTATIEPCGLAQRGQARRGDGEEAERLVPQVRGVLLGRHGGQVHHRDLRPGRVDQGVQTAVLLDDLRDRWTHRRGIGEIESAGSRRSAQFLGQALRLPRRPSEGEHHGGAAGGEQTGRSRCRAPPVPPVTRADSGSSGEVGGQVGRSTSSARAGGYPTKRLLD